MRYVMKQKLCAWGDDFVIRDDDERHACSVGGKALSLGDERSVQDVEGKELAYIKQSLLSWGPTYEIYRNDTLAAVVKRELFTLFNCRFNVDVPGPDDLEASGNFTDHEYAFTRHGETVARVSKQWFTWTDTYGVEVAEGEDDVLVLASTVVVDMACHPDRRRR